VLTISTAGPRTRRTGSPSSRRQRGIPVEVGRAVAACATLPNIDALATAAAKRFSTVFSPESLPGRQRTDDSRRTPSPAPRPDCGVRRRAKASAGASSSVHTLKLLRVWTERVLNRDVAGVATTRDQHPADSPRVVARVEGMPAAAQVASNQPAKSIGRPPARRCRRGSRCSDRPDVHATTEGNAECAKSRRLRRRECLERRAGSARVLVSKGDVRWIVVADRWTRPTRPASADSARRGLGQRRFAVPAAHQELEHVVGRSCTELRGLVTNASGAPLSFTIASTRRSVSPGGATMRVHHCHGPSRNP